MMHSDDDLIPALEMNEVGDMLPGRLDKSFPNEEVEELGLMIVPDPDGEKPFPQECAHPDCAKTPIVGVNKRFVCEDHLKWVLKPIREIIRLASDNTR